MNVFMTIDSMMIIFTYLYENNLDISETLEMYVTEPTSQVC